MTIDREEKGEGDAVGLLLSSMAALHNEKLPERASSRWQGTIVFVDSLVVKSRGKSSPETAVSALNVSIGTPQKQPRPVR